METRSQAAKKKRVNERKKMLEWINRWENEENDRLLDYPYYTSKKEISFNPQFNRNLDVTYATDNHKIRLNISVSDDDGKVSYGFKYHRCGPFGCDIDEIYTLIECYVIYYYGTSTLNNIINQNPCLLLDTKTDTKKSTFHVQKFTSK